MIINLIIIDQLFIYQKYCEKFSELFIFDCLFIINYKRNDIYFNYYKINKK